eukprot:scaffold1173_cov84-Cylindrotheca_fusiformis.AAC.5
MVRALQTASSTCYLKDSWWNLIPPRLLHVRYLGSYMGGSTPTVISADGCCLYLFSLKVKLKSILVLRNSFSGVLKADDRSGQGAYSPKDLYV